MIRHASIFWVSASLAVLGVLFAVVKQDWGSLSSLIIMLLLVGIVAYMYNRSTHRAVGRSRGAATRTKVKPSQKTMEKVSGIRKSHTSSVKRKNYPFQVIEGSKGKNDEKFPKYH